MSSDMTEAHREAAMRVTRAVLDLWAAMLEHGWTFTPETRDAFNAVLKAAEQSMDLAYLEHVAETWNAERAESPGQRVTPA